jgi:hypothetical protein
MDQLVGSLRAIENKKIAQYSLMYRDELVNNILSFWQRYSQCLAK